MKLDVQTLAGKKSVINSLSAKLVLTRCKSAVMSLRQPSVSAAKRVVVLRVTVTVLCLSSAAVLRRMALVHAHTRLICLKKYGLSLSSKASSKELIIIDDAAVKTPKTADLRKQLEKLGVTNGLIVSGNSVDENFAKAASNIPNLDVLPSQGANVYDILKRHTLVLTKQAVQDLEARLK